MCEGLTLFLLPLWDRDHVFPSASYPFPSHAVWTPVSSGEHQAGTRRCRTERWPRLHAGIPRPPLRPRPLWGVCTGGLELQHIPRPVLDPKKVCALGVQHWDAQHDGSEAGGLWAPLGTDRQLTCQSGRETRGKGPSMRQGVKRGLVPVLGPCSCLTRKDTRPFLFTPW